MTRPTFDPSSISPLWLVPIGLIVGTAAALLFGRGAFFLGTSAFALLGAIWVLWQSLQSLTGDAPLTLEEALGLGAPSAEEERKTAVLRALKDLEYERAVGKIEEEDFRVLSEKYRQEAKALLALLDDDLAPARQRVEKELEQRMAETAPSSSAPDDEPAADTKEKEAEP